MSFDGPALSFDDEGSILFDGEKIIVTVPVGHEALDHLGTEEDIPFPVVYTDPSHHQDQQASTPPPPSGGNPVFNKETVRKQVERARQARDSARNKESKPGKPDVAEDSPADREPVTDLPDFQPDANGEAPAAEEDWPFNTPLTQGQEMHIDHLLSMETDHLAREVLITLKREGMPHNSHWRDFLEQYALTGWYAASDAIAWATLAKIANSDWDETFAYADDEYVETAAQDLGDNAIEGLVVIGAETGDTVFDRPGVVRADGSQYVGMQDTEAEALRAEALSGRDLVFVHNHTEEIGASDEDLDSAFAAGAKVLIVITQQGQEYVYIRGRYGMVEVRDEKASYVVGPENPEETVELRIRSEAQAWAFQHDSPELVFLQEESSFQIRVEGEVQFAYSEEAVVLDEGNYGSDSLQASQSIEVIGKSRLNPYVIQVEYDGGLRLWIDLKEYGDIRYDFSGAENLAEIPYAEDSSANTENPYIRTAMGVADLLPIAQEDITEMGVIAFGATGNNAWESTGGFHPGFDIFAEAGTEVRAITSGEVVGIFVPGDVNYDHVYGSAEDSYVAKGETPGRIYDPQTVSVPARQSFADNWLVERDHRAYVIVRSGNAYILYGHLDPDSIQVGTHVVAGQPIGAVGDDPIDGNDHLHFEVKTHGQSVIPLDENEEYVARSKDQRPQFFLNPLYLYTKESRDGIIVEYGLKPLAEQLLAIEGTKPIDHSGHGVGFYWRDRTGILRSEGDK